MLSNKEIERKYLIEMPDITELQCTFNVEKVGIVQTYLFTEEPDTEERVRKKVTMSGNKYYHTKKQDITGLTRLEIECEITADEYLNLIQRADTNLKQIEKDRYSFEYMGHTIEIDIYSFWETQAICEVELVSEDEIVELPGILVLIEEVTGIKRYKNKELAKVTKK